MCTDPQVSCFYELLSEACFTVQYVNSNPPGTFQRLAFSQIRLKVCVDIVKFVNKNVCIEIAVKYVMPTKSLCIELLILLLK